MPIPFIIAGVVAAGTAIATSKSCRRCDDTFWSSDCSSYCQSCCDARGRERRREEEELRLEQERERERERIRIREEAKKAHMREEKRIKDEIERKKKAERARLKAIEDAKKAKIKAIEDEKERQRILLKKKADKKREDILNTLIIGFKKNELSQPKEQFQNNIFLEIDKDKNFQLKRINESQKLMLSQIDFKKQIDIYIEEV